LVVLALFVDLVAAVVAPEGFEAAGVAEAVEEGGFAAGFEEEDLQELRASFPLASFLGLSQVQASSLQASFPLSWELVSTRAYSHRNGVPRNLAKSTLWTYIQPPISPYMQKVSLLELLRKPYL